MGGKNTSFGLFLMLFFVHNTKCHIRDTHLSCKKYLYIKCIPISHTQAQAPHKLCCKPGLNSYRSSVHLHLHCPKSTQWFSVLLKNMLTIHCMSWLFRRSSLQKFLFWKIYCITRSLQLQLKLKSIYFPLFLYICICANQPLKTCTGKQLTQLIKGNTA